MGSCFSKNDKPPPTNAAPPEEEEETVKEVLSETPARTSSPCRESEQGSQPSQLLLPGGDNARISTSTTHAAATTTLNKVEAARGDEAKEEAKYRPRRSFSGDLPVKRPGTSVAAGGCPSMRSSPSPTPAVTRRKSSDASVSVGCRSARRSPSPSAVRKREGAVVRRTNSAREAASSRAPPTGSSSPRPRELDGSGSRRSFSTAVKRVAPDQRSPGGRSPSAPRSIAGGSPRRIPTSAAAPHKVDGGRRRPSSDSGMDAASATGEGRKESLENPLVSMECFIFL